MIFGSKLVGLFFSINTQNATTWSRTNSQSDESTWPIALLGYLEMKLMWARTTHIQACAGGDSVTRKTTIEQELRSSRALQ